MASTPDPPPAGGEGGYDVGGVLREGWAGTLHEGHYRPTGRRVTVEDVRSDLVATPGLVERLADIGRRSTALRHPNLLAVYDLVETAGALQVIAEWSDGPALAAWRRGRPAAAGLAVLDGILAGLAALHGAGLFCGRVAEDTVVVEAGGRARLAELAVCAAAAPPGAGRESDVRAAAQLGLDLLRGGGRRLDPARRLLGAVLEGRRQADADDLRTALAAAAEAALGPGWREVPAQPARRGPGRGRLAAAAALLLLLTGGGAALAIVLSGGHGPANPSPSGPLALGHDATLTVSPASGGCNTTFVFVARGSLSGTGTLVYRWEQSDGLASADTSLPITADEGSYQLTQAWRLQGSQSVDGTMTLRILQPAAMTLTRTFHYACS